ncbi:3-methyl-2-oxobutanoate hydroxymethyltransferase [Phycisphaerae bacterium RAS1]|nr:3-methyl-2-oxobutanoate hydroxymethyltransferase [Phycisphaerae bacterium RAS1]
MLTSYDFPTAALAQAAGVHSLLVGDSMGTVLLGRPNTRDVPLDLMVTLAEAVRRGAPRVWLVGDMPYVSLSRGIDVAIAAARRFRDEAGCDAVKIEAGRDEAELVSGVSRIGIDVIVHLGLRPQQVLTPNGYKAQARDEAAIAELVQDARAAVEAGAIMLLLEAVPNEATLAVKAAVDVPVVGCGAGPACDGHVVVTQDMLGFGAARVPRFVPALARLDETIGKAMERYVADIETGVYPRPEHVYPMSGRPVAAGEK